MTETEIITLSPEDWQRYRAIRLEALQTDPVAFGSSYEDMSQRPPEYWQNRLIEAARGERSWLLFAQAEGRLVGMIGAFVPEDTDSIARIVAVYVSPGWRGQGVGRQLMQAILDVLRRQPTIRRAGLGVSIEQTAAQALYQRFGFQITGTKEDVMGDGQAHKGYLMELALE